jgi:hypothetical protein
LRRVADAPARPAALCFDPLVGARRKRWSFAWWSVPPLGALAACTTLLNVQERSLEPPKDASAPTDVGAPDVTSDVTTASEATPDAVYFPPNGGAKTFVADAGCPGTLVLDDAYLYWTRPAANDNGGGSVVRAALDGGAVETIASEQGPMLDLSIWNHKVYWIGVVNGREGIVEWTDGSLPSVIQEEDLSTIGGLSASADGVFYTLSVAGAPDGLNVGIFRFDGTIAAAIAYMAGMPGAVKIGGQNAYVVEFQNLSGMKVGHVPTTDTTIDPITWLDLPNPTIFLENGALAADMDGVAVAWHDAVGSSIEIADGADFLTRIDAVGSPMGVALTAQHVYWYDVDQVWRSPRVTSTPSILYATPFALGGLAVDPANVYVGTCMKRVEGDVAVTTGDILRIPQ